MIHLILDELVTLELVQLSGIGNGRLLAFHESSAKDFLYPYPKYTPDYDVNNTRYRLMERTLDFEVCEMSYSRNSRMILSLKMFQILSDNHKFITSI